MGVACYYNVQYLLNLLSRITIEFLQHSEVARGPTLLPIHNIPALRVSWVKDNGGGRNMMTSARKAQVSSSLEKNGSRLARIAVNRDITRATVCDRRILLFDKRLFCIASPHLKVGSVHRRGKRGRESGQGQWGGWGSRRDGTEFGRTGQNGCGRWGCQWRRARVLGEW